MGDKVTDKKGGKKDPKEQKKAEKKNSSPQGGSDKNNQNIPSSAPQEPVNDVAEQMGSFFSPTGMSTSSYAEDILTKYGGLAMETGRRGSQAREQIFQSSDPGIEAFINSEAYQKLKDNPSAIRDSSIQKQMVDAGIDIKKFAYGQSSSDGDVYNRIDFEMLDKYLQSKANPLKQAGKSIAEDIYAAGNMDAGVIDQNIQSPVKGNGTPNTPNTPGDPSLSRQTDPGVFATKRI